MTLYVFKGTVTVVAGTGLAGYASRIEPGCRVTAQLVLAGLGVKGGQAWELCSLDALYPGALASRFGSAAVERVFAASHTHFAPTLDPGKPKLGRFEEANVDAYASALESAHREAIDPDGCDVYRAEVEIPIYRRFDAPDTALRRLLTRRGGAVPNAYQEIDRGLYLFVLKQGGKPVACLAYHACHPVSRSDTLMVSADYVEAIRSAVLRRFGLAHCMFLQGCAGDVRPNIHAKRRDWLPDVLLNQRFKSPPDAIDQATVDKAYGQAVERASLQTALSLSGRNLRFSNHHCLVRGLGEIPYRCLDFYGLLDFVFLPFELSHRFHLECLASVGAEGLPRSFLVSCCDDTLGYLPHPSQLAAGGYEVDTSRRFMNLPQRLVVEPGFVSALTAAGR